MFICSKTGLYKKDVHSKYIMIELPAYVGLIRLTL